MKKLFAFLTGAASTMFAGVALVNAQQVPPASTPGINNLLETFGNLLTILIPILISLAIVFFFIALIRYIMAKEDQDKQKARAQMIQGLIAIFLMLSFFGIIQIISATFSIGTGGTIDSTMIPSVIG